MLSIVQRFVLIIVLGDGNLTAPPLLSIHIMHRPHILLISFFFSIYKVYIISSIQKQPFNITGESTFVSKEYSIYTRYSVLPFFL